MTKYTFPMLIHNNQFEWFNDNDKDLHLAFAMMSLTSKQIMDIYTFEIQGLTRKLTVNRVYDHLVKCPYSYPPIEHFYKTDGYVFVNCDPKIEGLTLFAWLFPMLTR